MNEGMRRYISGLPQADLTRQQELLLADRIWRGGEDGDEAYKELVQKNLRLVVKIANDYKNMGLSFSDLISHGNIGLLRAAEKFNPVIARNRDSKFSTYAAWWIKRNIRDAIGEEGACGYVLVPSAMRVKATKLKRQVEEMQRRDGLMPDLQQICAETQKTARQVKLQLKVSKMRSVSVESCQDHGHEVAYEQPDHYLEKSEGVAHMRGCLAYLPERERLVLSLRFGLDGGYPKTLSEIGRLIERTTERVRQIEKQALKNLRDIFEEMELGDAMAV